MNELHAKPVVKRRLLANTQQIVKPVLLPQDPICGSKRFVLFKGKAAWIDRSDRTSGCLAYVSSLVIFIACYFPLVFVRVFAFCLFYRSRIESRKSF